MAGVPVVRASGDIDPHREDAAVQPKRGRKDRKRPPPPGHALAGSAEILARVNAMPGSPGLMQERRGDRWMTTAPHSDLSLWELQLAEAFGTRSTSLRRTFLTQLKRLVPQDWDEDHQAWKTNETEWNALLAMVADHAPENTTQAALAAQMAAVHLMTMRLSEQALGRGAMIMERDAALASKLARTYAQQCETMMILKGKRQPIRQTISVEKTIRQEMHYHDHRQGGVPDSAEQPEEARASAARPCVALPGPNQVNGEVVPFSRDAGEARLPQARGKGGRSQG